MTRLWIAVHRAKSGWRAALTAAFVLLLSFVSAPALAQTTGSRDFDHLSTGYPLTGAHTTARCESCHQGGVFKGTPRNCDSCHVSGARLAVNTVVKTATHIPTTLACDTCHNTRTFTGARMNHTGVARGTCATCHNGQQATGKTPDHLATTQPCDTCHSSSAWRPASGFDHSGVTPGTCATCHNGVRATGTSANHVPFQQVSGTASASCDTCHRSGFRTWLPAKVHANATIVAQCATCHAGIKPATPVHAGQTTCENCHKSTSTWTSAKVDHATFNASTNCAGCHNGTGATGKNATHIPVGATGCFSCHNTTTWKPTKFNHTQVPVTAQCATCHSGAYPPADGKSASHTPYQLVSQLAASSCDTCHKAGYTAWTPAKLHTSVTLSAQCSVCHLASRPTTQVHTGQTLCENCHKSTTTWTGAKVDHSTFNASTVCSSCHNGTNASGKNATHIPSGTTNCYACHNTTTWKPTKFNHTQVPVTAVCATCHSGAYPPADGKNANHLPYQLVASLAAANCDSCHKAGYTSWAGGKVHTNPVTTSCKTCHSGAFTSEGAVGKPTNHIPEAQLLNGAAMECNACHSSTTAWTERMNHNNSLGASAGSGRCIACHQTGTSYLGTMRRMSLTHQKKTPPAVDCSESGCHRPLGTKGSTYSKWD